MGYSPSAGVLFGSDYNSDLYTVDITTGTRTFVGAMADQLPVDSGPPPIASRNRGLAFAVSQVCSTPPGGMVSWWPADNTAADIQGHHDGSWQGTAAYAGGEVGTAFSFNGDPANYILVQPDTSLDLTVFTVDAWVYPTAVAPAQWILNKGAQATLANYDLALTDTNRAEINFDAPTVGHQSVDSTDPIPLNAWTHITGTYDGTTLKLYINGVPNNSQVFGTTPSATGQPRSQPWPARPLRRVRPPGPQPSSSVRRPWLLPLRRGCRCLPVTRASCIRHNNFARCAHTATATGACSSSTGAGRTIFCCSWTVSRRASVTSYP